MASFEIDAYFPRPPAHPVNTARPKVLVRFKAVGLFGCRVQTLRDGMRIFAIYAAGATVQGVTFSVQPAETVCPAPLLWM